MDQNHNFNHLRVATRRSPLAVTQTRLLLDQMAKQLPGLSYELVLIHSQGDLEPERELSSFGNKGVFSGALEEALRTGQADLAVHSLKDLSVRPGDEFAFPVLSTRENPADVLVTRKGVPVSRLGKGTRCGTSSPRRRMQLQTLFPDWQPIALRGNVETRLRKLSEGECDCLILAAAGLNRLNLLTERAADFEFTELSCDDMIPACGQGILAVQTLSARTDLNEWLQTHCDCRESRVCYEVEKELVLHLGASCQAPVATYACFEGDRLMVRACNGLGGPAYMKKICMPVSDDPVERLAFKQSLTGRVCLVGAGPGDPGLLTIAGSNRLREADVVVYDHLGTTGLGAYRSPEAEWIYVGKRAGHHTLPQEEINDLLLRLALEGKRVVRLKGGDPFVFGRGGEELLHLRAHDIPCEVIPGITSAVAAPAAAGIPVTHRGLVSSFHVFTGRKGTGALEEDWDYRKMAASEGTLVFLMGVGNLRKLVDGLLAAGKSPDTPAAIIENGTLPAQREVIGTLGTLPELARRQNVKAPAVTVVGSVVSLYEEPRRPSSERLPLSGRRVLVTAAATSVLADLLVAQGADPVALNLISCVQSPALMAELDDGLADYFRSERPAGGWLVLTSANGVRSFFASLDRIGADRRTLAGWRFAVVGTATAAVLREYGYSADLIPDEYHSAALAAALTAVTRPQDLILAVRARKASPLLGQILTENGRTLVCLTAYDTAQDDLNMAALPTLLPGVTDLTFASASAVQAFVDAAASSDLDLASFIKEDVHIFAIGPATAAALHEHGLKVTAEAEVSTFGGLVDCMTDYYKK